MFYLNSRTLMWQAYNDENREKAEKSVRARDFSEERS